MANKAMISFSFDDGRKDNIDLAKECLLPKNIPATFNITTGYVDGTAPDCIKSSVLPMSIEDIKWLYSQHIFEIALHGDKHRNDGADVETGRIKLCDWLNLSKDTKFGFASPHSAFSLLNYGRYFDTDKITYIRVGSKVDGRSALKAKEKMQKISEKISKKGFISRILNRYIDTNFFINRQKALFFRDSMMGDVGNKIIYSVPIYRGDSPETVNYIIKYVIKHKLSIVLMFHSVSQTDDDNIYNYRMDDFYKICRKFILLREKKKCSIVTVQKLYDNLKRTK